MFVGTGGAFILCSRTHPAGPRTLPYILRSLPLADSFFFFLSDGGAGEGGGAERGARADKVPVVSLFDVESPLWAQPLAGKLHLAPPPPPFSASPPVITLAFPSGGLGTPVTLLLLPSRGDSNIHARTLAHTNTHTHTWTAVLPITRARPSLLGIVRYT